MACSSRLTWKKMEGNNLLKNQGFEANLALVSAYESGARMGLKVTKGITRTT